MTLAGLWRSLGSCSADAAALLPASAELPVEAKEVCARRRPGEGWAGWSSPLWLAAEAPSSAVAVPPPSSAAAWPTDASAAPPSHSAKPTKLVMCRLLRMRGVGGGMGCALLLLGESWALGEAAAAGAAATASAVDSRAESQWSCCCCCCCCSAEKCSAGCCAGCSSCCAAAIAGTSAGAGAGTSARAGGPIFMRGRGERGPRVACCTAAARAEAGAGAAAEGALAPRPGSLALEAAAPAPSAMRGGAGNVGRVAKDGAPCGARRKEARAGSGGRALGGAAAAESAAVAGAGRAAVPWELGAGRGSRGAAEGAAEMEGGGGGGAAAAASAAEPATCCASGLLPPGLEMPGRDRLGPSSGLTPLPLLVTWGPARAAAELAAPAAPAPLHPAAAAGSAAASGGGEAAAAKESAGGGAALCPLRLSLTRSHLQSPPTFEVVHSPGRRGGPPAPPMPQASAGGKGLPAGAAAAAAGAGAGAVGAASLADVPAAKECSGAGGE